VRRLLAVCLVAFFGLPLLAAAPTSLSIKPSVIVYPFVPTGSSVDREASSRLATLIATQMANTGKVTVLPPPPGTERKDYLAVARAQNADYYVAGFISPLGAGVSLVEQVVSTTTGIVVFSQSTQINTYAEAAGQGDDLAQYISSHANRALAGIGTPPPQASPTPAASNGPQANLNGLFNRRKKSTPAPKSTAKPTPAPAASAPAASLTNVTPAPASAARAAAANPTAAPGTPPPAAAAVAAGAARTASAQTYAVVAVEGSADAALRELATQRVVARTNGERAQSAAAACAGHPVRAVLTATLAVGRQTAFGGGTARFELTASDCAGKVEWRQTHASAAGSAQGQRIATERAVDAALAAYLSPPKRGRS
jgi:TolB-like protein